MSLDPLSLTPVPEHTDTASAMPPDAPQMEMPEYFSLPGSLQQQPHAQWQADDDLPHFGHAVLFFAMAAPLLFLGEMLSVYLFQITHIFGNKSYHDIFQMMTSDARVAIPTQALTYALLALAVVVIFRAVWQQPFSQGIHWNVEAATTRFLPLCLLGLGVGFGITMLGNYLPMPKDPPIMQDMMESPLGAWMMLVFGITFAPIMEEMAFRGFLLPGLIHALRWLMKREILSPEALSWATVPISVVLTTIPFALLHATQVSHAWAPLLLIGLVSVTLCVVRLRLQSVAASAVVHAAYNFTLFAGLLLETGGFQHLDKLNS